MDYRHGAHSVFEIHLHFVWVTKYRKPVLTGEVSLRVRELIRQSCREEEVEILKGHVAKDHVHLFVSIPPQVTISRLVQRLKGKAPTICSPSSCIFARRSGTVTGGPAATSAAAAAT
jgi:putative transposase